MSLTIIIKVQFMDNMWSKVIDSLKEKVGQQNFDIWIKPIQLVSLEGENLKI